MFLNFHKEGVRRFAAGAISATLVLAFLFSALPQAAIAAPPVAQDASCAQTHTVVAGDTLSGISAKYDISVAEIATANNLKEPYTLSVGQELCIPGAAGAATPETTATSTSGSSTTSTGKDPSITLSVDESAMLTIVTKNFPTKSSFYVKVAASGRGTLKYTKIGFLRTKKEGAVSKLFKLPKDFRKVPTISVCVKNVRTDDQLCQRVSTGFQR
jgi:LysM repeat protein